MSFLFFGRKEKQLETGIEQQEKTTHNDTLKTNDGDVLLLKNIHIGKVSVTKEEAIEMAGQVLVDGGYAMSRKNGGPNRKTAAQLNFMRRSGRSPALPYPAQE